MGGRQSTLEGVVSDEAGRDLGESLYRLCERLYPICRSITGQGVRDSLAALAPLVELTVHEVPSGSAAFDWTVPPEWNLRRGYLVGPAGNRVVDSAEHNLHVVGYSEPVDRTLSLEDLQPHLHSLPDQPEAIPYRTSYFQPAWGFCLPHRLRESLPPGEYRAVIDSTLAPGALTYGEFRVPGTSNREILISTHVCHPSLANDNLSGITVAAHLAAHFAAAAQPPRYGLRFVFVPGTIGAITWLARNEAAIGNFVGGLVLSGVGDRGPFTYKMSRHGAGLIDRLFESALGREAGSRIRPFLPYGYDERQYCSPGIDIAAGCLMRTPYGEYPEYHTSGDDLSLLSADALAGTFELCRRVLADAQCVDSYVNLSPKCEPQLGRRGLYDNVGGDNQSKTAQLALLWLLSYSDGAHSTLDIHELSGIDLAVLDGAARRLGDAGLLAPANHSKSTLARA